jgi:hypothetical protein
MAIHPRTRKTFDSEGAEDDVARDELPRSGLPRSGLPQRGLPQPVLTEAASTASATIEPPTAGATTPEPAPTWPDQTDAAAPPEAEPVDPDFDEATYLRAFPDIAEAVRRGTIESGLAHFRRDGKAEARLQRSEYRALLRVSAAPPPPVVVIDALTMTPSGATLITGWSDDRLDTLTEIQSATGHAWPVFPRLVRTDVERTLEVAPGHRHGFLLVAAPADGQPRPEGEAMAEIEPAFRFASGATCRVRRDPANASDADVRDLALAAVQTAVGAEHDPEIVRAFLDKHVGEQIGALNRFIASQALSRRLIEHFGPARGSYRGSVITSLRGAAEQILPWLTLVAGGPGAGEYEFILVVTDPDQFEPALRAARVAEATIGLSLTIVLHPGGDSAATGEAAAQDIARSGRLIFMDQSVFPSHPDWAARHSTLLGDAPATRTRLMGTTLFRADGSLANGGYYFEREASLMPGSREHPRRIATVNLKAQTHPAPSAARMSLVARPVPGVPAAFMSVDRDWFETLGGFTRRYCRGVHEDIDLCLRSLRRGVAAWVHPMPMLHFARRNPLRPEPSRGGAIFNDWLLHRQWDAMIVPALLGRDPALWDVAGVPPAAEPVASATLTPAIG